MEVRILSAAPELSGRGGIRSLGAYASDKPEPDSVRLYPPLLANARGRGGIGIRAALRRLWEKSRGGSTPLVRTNPQCYSHSVAEGP